MTVCYFNEYLNDIKKKNHIKSGNQEIVPYLYGNISGWGVCNSFFQVYF